MAIRNILTLPDPILREKAQPVKKITPNIIKLLENMADTMYDAPGVGLAANQIGVLKRVIVVDVGDGLVEIINPEIVSASGRETGTEACLSVPGLQGEVTRFTTVVVKGLDRDGLELEIEAGGLFARVLQHEIDHLDGVVFIDRVVRWVKNNHEER